MNVIRQPLGTDVLGESESIGQHRARPGGLTASAQEGAVLVKRLHLLDRQLQALVKAERFLEEFLCRRAVAAGLRHGSAAAQRSSHSSTRDASARRPAPA